MKTELEWNNSEEELPDSEERVLVFSPRYPNPVMRFKIMDGKFLRFFTEATYWARLSDPKIGEEDE